jgi:hypothetical protein
MNDPWRLVRGFGVTLVALVALGCAGSPQVSTGSVGSMAGSTALPPTPVPASVDSSTVASDVVCNQKALRYVEGYGHVNRVLWSGPLTLDAFVSWKSHRQSIASDTTALVTTSVDTEAEQAALSVPPSATLDVCIYEGDFEIHYSTPERNPPNQTEVGVIVLPNGNAQLDFSRPPGAAPVSLPG